MAQEHALQAGEPSTPQVVPVPELSCQHVKPDVSSYSGQTLR
jgi:hypothetical protein